MARERYHKLCLYTSVGLINLTIFTVFYAVNTKPPVLASASSITQALYTPKAVELKQGVPTRIAIPSLAIDTPVKVGVYNVIDDSWSIDENNAYFAEPSAKINNLRGNSLVYGHRLPAVFERLSAIKANDEAIVYTDTGYTFKYRYVSRDDVDPTNTSIFDNQGRPTLTLQTCSGSWDQYRALYSFKLISVDKT